MTPIPGVTIVQGDFVLPETQQQVVNLLPAGRAHLVLSDMAPNMSGIGTVDQARVMALAEVALEFARRVLQPRGAFLFKVFHGEGFRELVDLMRGSFIRIDTRKPSASRDRSSEVYLLGQGPAPAPAQM
jgi:23S rRNA (uridine2552-2'-O)-methyltransferase